jgi:hypothetical protein
MIELPGETALTVEPERPRETPQLLAAVARASASIARLDYALASHPLLPAVLYRARLDAARRAAAVDGQAAEQALAIASGATALIAGGRGMHA